MNGDRRTVDHHAAARCFSHLPGSAKHAAFRHVVHGDGPMRRGIKPLFYDAHFLKKAARLNKRLLRNAGEQCGKIACKNGGAFKPGGLCKHKLIAGAHIPCI